MDVSIGGHVEPGFAAVKDAFSQNFEAGHETGAAFCLHVDGRKVVDLYGGSFDAVDGGDVRPALRPGHAAAGLLFDQGCHRGVRKLAGPTGRARPGVPGGPLLARVRPVREGGNPRPVAPHPPGRAPGGGRHAEPGRGPGLGSGDRRPRGTAAVVGAGHCARLSRADLRVVGRRGDTPRHGALPGHLLRRGDRRTPRPRVLDRTARGARAPGLAPHRRRPPRG